MIDLSSGRVVAYEALARGPEGSPLERPDLLFRIARETGRLDELDWECRREAIAGALAAGMAPPLTLFANVEPVALTSPIPGHVQESVALAAERLRIVVEVTERAIADRPAELLAAVAAIRARGWGLAVDDVGADAASLALMPFLRPDVIKLDLRLVRDRPDAQIASVVGAVNAESERSGAAILAEGIETEEHLETALAMGATLGQGWLFGRPGRLPEGLESIDSPAVPLIDHPVEATGETPFDILARARTVRFGRESLLAALSRRLEVQALNHPEPPLLVASFQEARHFTPRIGRRYASLAQGLPFAGAIGVGMPLEPAPGVRGARIEPGDPLRAIWSLHLVGPHFAAALTAREVTESGAADRAFEFALSYERELVIPSARTLLRRVAPM